MGFDYDLYSYTEYFYRLLLISYVFKKCCISELLTLFTIYLGTC